MITMFTNRSHLIHHSRSESAITLVEIMIVISVVFVGVLLFLPSREGCKCKAVRINCASNLKQVALAYRIWEGDNGDLFPMKYYTNSAGEPLFTNAFRYYQVMSNEVNNPKILVCPADTKRDAATNFTTDLNDSRVSYFVSLDADETMPQVFLAGDRNIENGVKPVNRILELTTNQTVCWTKEIHQNAGNVALSDGSVQQWSTAALQNALKQTGLTTNRLLFP